MAFCANCGTKVDENIKFCPKCGTSVNQEIVNTRSNNMVAQSNNLRNIEAEATRVYEYFNAKRDLFDEAVRISRELNDDSLPKRWYLVVLFFSFLPGTLILENIAIGCILTAAWFALFIFLIVWRRKKLNDIDERRIRIKERQDYIFDYLEKYYDAYENCPVAIDYIWPNDLQKITDYILAGRAYSFKEAINLFHQQEQIEEMQSKMDEMVYNTQMASVKSGLSAHYSALNYYTK